MAEVGSYEAKTHLSGLLDRVERGERITITRHGVPVAVLVPASARWKGASHVITLFEDAVRSRHVIQSDHQIITTTV